MDYAVVAIAALAASTLTLFSGFGLGTLLMPVIALFLPVSTAIAATAVVHLANNLFKLALLGRRADWAVVRTFGVPAVLAAFLGAGALARLGALPPLHTYRTLGRLLEVSPLKATIGVLIVGFAVLESSDRFGRLALDRRWLPAGGALSGFFGGLSGHQGAFRSMFLLKAGLEPEAFVATGVGLACLVDAARMVVYGSAALVAGRDIPWGLVTVACCAAFAGAYGGARLLEKVTRRAVRAAVSVLLVVVGLLLVAGVV